MYFLIAHIAVDAEDTWTKVSAANNTCLKHSVNPLEIILLYIFYCCTVHFDICRFHSATNALFYFKKHIKIYVKIQI